MCSFSPSYHSQIFAVGKACTVYLLSSAKATVKNVTLCVHYARYVKFGYDLVLQKWTFTTAPHTRVAPHWTFDCASFGCKLYSEHLIIYFQTTANKKKIKLHKTSKDRTSRMQCTFCETMTVLVRLFLENNLYINSVLKK